jgi:3-deoxy-7-phosphoheptulonate synthase
MSKLNIYDERIEDIRIVKYSQLIAPYELKNSMPLSGKAKRTVLNSRANIKELLYKDGRILLVVGPCSIHDIEVAKDYAKRLNSLKKRVKDRFEIVMRTYFEKPRSVGGWEGLIYEPCLDGRESVNKGLQIARELLIYNAELGLASATEFVDTFVPQYIGDLISWAAIGARTVESPTHRRMASGLSMPVGFKNNTQGNVEVAVQAVMFAKQGHKFLGIDKYGKPCEVTTSGNPDTHIVLRGGSGANYDRESVAEARALLRKAGLNDRLMIDCSHGNSNKDYRQQPAIFEDVIGQIFDRNSGIMGIMLESNIYEGRQDIPKNLKELKYGISITDSCIGWQTTENLILNGYKMLSRRSF